MNRYFVISDNKTDSQKYLLQHHEWTAEIGSHRPWLLIYHAMQYTGNAWVLCTRAPRRAFPDLLFSSNLNRGLLHELHSFIWLQPLYYEMRLLWMRIRLGQIKRSLPKSRALICVQKALLRRPT